MVNHFMQIHSSNPTNSANNIAIKAAAIECIKSAQALAHALHLPLITEQENFSYPFLLIVTPIQLELHAAQISKTPLVIDFLKGKLAYRYQKKFGKELLAKAIGLKAKQTLSVIDATAGLGRDGFLLANLDCDVLLLEKSPVIAALLADGLSRALQDPLYNNLKIRLLTIDAKDYLQNLLPEAFPDVIYLDPMYPARSKSALVKKEMRFLQEFLDKENPDLLFQIAMTRAKKRVVVKRSIVAPSLMGLKPNHTITGKNTRFDVYIINH